MVERDRSSRPSATGNRSHVNSIVNRVRIANKRYFFDRVQIQQLRLVVDHLNRQILDEHWLGLSSGGVEPLSCHNGHVNVRVRMDREVRRSGDRRSSLAKETAGRVPARLPLVL